MRCAKSIASIERKIQEKELNNMAATFDVYKEYKKLVPIFFASTGLDPFYLEKWNPEYPLDLDKSCKKLAEVLGKMVEHGMEGGVSEDAMGLIQTCTMQVTSWMYWAKDEGSIEAKRWLAKHNEFVSELLPALEAISYKPPFNLSIWEELTEALDGRSGLVFDLDGQMKDIGIISTSYLYQNWYFLFEILDPTGLRAYFMVRTEDKQDNQLIIDKVKEYLLRKKKNLKLRIVDKAGELEGAGLALDIARFDMYEFDTYDKTIEKAVWFVNNVEKAVQTIDFAALNKEQKVPYAHIRPAEKEQIIMINDWGHEIISRDYWREGFLVIQSGSKLRKAVLAGEDLLFPESEIEEFDFSGCYKEEWFFPDTEMGKKAQALFDEGKCFDELGESFGQKYLSRSVFLKGEYLTKVLGFAMEKE